MSWLTESNEQVQGSKAWHEWRSRHIGASEVSAILGESDFMSAHDLWLLKTGQAAPFAGNWATRRGQDAEPEIRGLYETRYGVTLVSPVLEFPEWPVLSASLDGYSKDHGVVVEFKFPSKQKHEQAELGEVPKTYIAQIQAQLLVAECDTAHYVSYNGKEIAVVEVKADKEIQKRILSAAQVFWEYVEKKIPPPGGPVILESETLETLATRYKELDKISTQTEMEMKLIKQKLDELVETDSASFYGLHMHRIMRKGAVDYAKIPELKGVNLEQYRKGDTKVLTIRVKD